MTTPEKPSLTPKEIYTTYFDGLKDDRGRVRTFNFVLSLKTSTMFVEFLENFAHVGTATDYAGFHATDPNWYEEGKYRTGILHPKLYEELEGYFKKQKILEDDQTLTPICHYSNQSDGRGNLVIEVSGGRRHDWDQFILCYLEKDFSEFDFQENVQTIDSMKKLAQETGRQEISFEEARRQYLERKKRAQEKI